MATAARDCQLLCDVTDQPHHAAGRVTHTDLPCAVGAVPFDRLHAQPEVFHSLRRNCFVSDAPVRVKITRYERTSSSHLLHPYIYTIECENGRFRWTIRHRQKHFAALHKSLRLVRARMLISMSSGARRLRNIADSAMAERARAPAVPRFPQKSDSLMNEFDLPGHMQQLEDYLNAVLCIAVYRSHRDLLEFMEVSQWSFIEDLGDKFKEGVVSKRIGSAVTNEGPKLCGVYFQFRRFAGSYIVGWRKRWLIVKDTYVLYVRPKDGTIRSVLLMDNHWSVQRGIYGAHVTDCLTIANGSRNLQVKCWTKRKTNEWLDNLKHTYDLYGRVFVEPCRYESFAPVRASGCRARWYVDGSGYFSDVAGALAAARHQVFITDWWLSPEIFLRRPALVTTNTNNNNNNSCSTDNDAGDGGDGDHRWRLDQLLLRKAEEGVKIYVMLYKEVELALGINSFYSKTKLMVHKNIKVVRHPDHAGSGVLLWAHHEKLVIVDQSYAFVGGIDLCYGRWDDHFHRLVDIGGAPGDSQIDGATSATTGAGATALYRSAVTSSTPANAAALPHSLMALARGTNLATLNTMTVSAAAPPAAPPAAAPADTVTALTVATASDSAVDTHSVTTVGTVDLNANGKDIVDYNPTAPAAGAATTASASRTSWNGFHGDSECVKGETPPRSRRRLLANALKARHAAAAWTKLATARQRPVVTRENEAYTGDQRESVSRAHPLPDDVSKQGPAATQNESDICDELDSNRHKNINARLWLGKDYANFIVKDFGVVNAFMDHVDRWRVPRMPWHDIAASVVGPAARDVARHFIQRWNAIKLEKLCHNNDYEFLVPKSYIDFDCDSVPDIFKSPSYRTKCQIVRSASQWSASIAETEDSIHQAYLDLIGRARHYIYIENQFFVSLCGSSGDTVQNRVCEALFQRIVSAHAQGAVFRVYVVLPLLPGFEGQVGTASGVAIQAITHWNYASICRGKQSLIGKLLEYGISEPQHYVSFHGLRTHAVLAGQLVSELIYVHSKLMIVDDLAMICGSANINDRSLLGSRDSEVCMVVEDLEFDDGVFNGAPVQVGRFVSSLRRRIFSEHLGLLERPDEAVSVGDPVAASFYQNVWRQMSTTNTDIYEQVFKCIPTDKVRSFAELQSYQCEVPLALSLPSLASEILRPAKGFLVNLPFHFLAEENLKPTMATKEGLMPTTLWT